MFVWFYTIGFQPIAFWVLSAEGVIVKDTAVKPSAVMDTAAKVSADKAAGARAIAKAVDIAALLLVVAP